MAQIASRFTHESGQGSRRTMSTNSTARCPDESFHTSCTTVMPSLNRAGRTFATLALIAEGVRWQVRELGPQSRGRFEVTPDNTPLLRFQDRHLAPWVLDHVEKQRLVKRLAPVDPMDRGAPAD